MKGEAFSLTLPNGGRLSGLVDKPEGARPEALVVIVPGFGRTQLDYAIPTLYLKGNGIAVVRFDAHNHVGASDGEIFDFTLSGLLQDVEHVVDFVTRELAPRRVGVLASSLGGRVAIRALGRGLRVHALASLSTVVWVRDTLTRVAGEDVVGLSTEDPRIESYEILDERVGRGFLLDLLEHGWEGSSGTLRDLAGAERVPALWVQGNEDPWLDVAASLRTLATYPSGRALVLEDASHKLNFASAKVAMRHVVRFFHSNLLGLANDNVKTYQFQDLVAKMKGDRIDLKRITS